MTESTVSVDDEERRLRERLKAKQRSRRNSSSDGSALENAENNGKRKTDSNGESNKNGGETKASDGSSAERSQQKLKRSSSSRDSRSRSPRRSPSRHRRGNRQMNHNMHRGPYYGGGGSLYPPHGSRHYDRSRDYVARGYDQYGYRGPGPDTYRGDRHGPPYRPYEGPPPQHGHPQAMVHRGWNSSRRHYDTDPYGRARRPRSRSRSRSVSSYSSRSRSAGSDSSRSRSPSRSRSDDGDSQGDRRAGRRSTKRRESRARREYRSSSSEYSYSSSSDSSSDDSDREESDRQAEKSKSNAFTKDQRTVFVNQLVTRTTEKDIRRYFRRKVGCKINEVILLRDKRTGRHKGCAYVELKHIEDVHKALQVSGQAPDFQRFPILVKASEAEKNYIIPASSATVTAGMMGSMTRASPLVGPNGKLLEAQKVYVGSLDPSITQDHLFALFSQFGQLQRVSVQMDPSSGISKGFAFLSFHDPKEANLAIQTMSNQVLAGRPMKTGWASQTSTTPGVEVVTSEEFPEDATARAQKAHVVLAQLSIGAGLTASTLSSSSLPTGAGSSTSGQTSNPSRVPTVAEARASLASAASGLTMSTSVSSSMISAGVTSSQLGDAKVIGGASNPTNHVLVRNMFDKDEETEEGWEDEIRTEFREECSQYGKISNVVVMSREPGGKIYASFETVDGAKKCASNLAGRWFDKRQLSVEFVLGHQVPVQA